MFSWVLGIGVLLIAVLSTSGAGGEGLIVANTLFGSIFGFGTAVSVGCGRVGLGGGAGAAGDRPSAAVRRRWSRSWRALHGVPVEGARAGVAAVDRGGHRRGDPGDRSATRARLDRRSRRRCPAAHPSPISAWALSVAIALVAMWGGSRSATPCRRCHQAARSSGWQSARMRLRPVYHRSMSGPAQTKPSPTPANAPGGVGVDRGDGWIERAEGALAGGRPPARGRAAGGARAARHPEVRAHGG